MCRNKIVLIMLISFLSFFMFGCSKSPSIDTIDKEKAKELSITNTVKAELDDKNSRVFILATYLNPLKISEIDDNKENFLVNIYTDQKQQISLGTSNNPFYKIYLNNKIYPQDFAHIMPNNMLLKLVPIKNRWSSNYLITFPKQKENVLKITFENANKQKTTLTFLKEM